MMKSLIVLTFLFTIFFFHQSSSSTLPITYSVLNLGAKPDGKTDSTKSFLSAWALACGSAQPATIYVPPGRYLIGRPANFGGLCKTSAITIRIDGTLVAPSNYNVLGNAGNWLLFEGVNGVSIAGGMLDGQGASLWACKASGKTCPDGATTLSFTNSNNILISGLTSINSQLFHIVINGCDNVKLQGVKVPASGNSSNTDGIHVQLSSGVTILNSKISTGDDCVSIGAGNTNLWIENVACGPGHGISIGSTENGVRTKTWGRPSNGFVRGVLFQHAMWCLGAGVFLVVGLSPTRSAPTTKVALISGVKISDITYSDIHGTSATEVAVKFLCSKAHSCSGIRLEDVKLTYKNQPAKASCANARGTSSGIVQPMSCL
ncbi:unnamed protein product [Camellia sinensis]